MLIPLVDADPRTLGGKGAALRRLVDHGFPVPPAWVLPYAALARFLDHHGLTALAAAAGDEPDTDLPARIRALPLPFELACPAPLVAVRSSARDEDRASASGAGQYESVLGVDAAGLADAVRRVWASYYAPHAWAYRARHPADPTGMAVVVQEMVDARCAGVLFTTNPVTGSWRESTVEAVWGLGDPLVGGRIVPDRYLVSRPRRTPRPVQRALAAARLKVEEETVVRQDTQLVVTRAGLVDAPTDAPLARKLGREEIVRLCRWGLRAESLMGGPQDLEWAIDRAGRQWILQSRPITVKSELPRGGATLWTRRFIGERFPYGATPLGWSIVGPVLDWFIDYPATSARYLGGEAPLRLVRGHPYVNVTVFRHLAFKLPGAPPPRFMLEFFPPDEARAWVARAAAPPDLRVYASIFDTTFREQRWRRFRWNPLTNPAAWDAFRAALPERLAALERGPARRALALAEPLIRDYVKIHVTSLLFANMSYEIVGPLLPAELRDVLLRPPAGSITRAVNAELWQVGRHPDRLAGFLARHGHRSDASWEVFSRRWVEEPDAVLRLARLAADGPDPAAHAAEEEAATAAALATLRRPLRAAVRLTQSYLRLREEQRYHLDRVFWALKRRLLELGAELLDDPADIRFLTVGELDGRLPPDELRRTVARRAQEPVDPDPPDFLVGEEALPVPAGDAHRLQGIGVSPGVVRGRVRIVTHPEEGDALHPGEILVARATDPGWTPLFHRAGGLVLELGGLLSHGSVVAREYRLPAVCSVPGATHLLRDGMEVTVDGRGGTVWVHG